jgi:hypothetical protein
MIKMLTTITNVQEKQRVLRGIVIDRDLPSQRVDVKYESLGWFITIKEGISFFVGMDEPELKIGDALTLMLEKR